MKIAIAQMNSTIGAFAQNRQKIISLSTKAEALGADLVLFPELALCGYPPMDILDQKSFTEMNLQSIHILQKELPQNIAVGIGFVNKSPYQGGKSLVNAYAVLQQGKIVHEQIKTLLPTYDVFDEARNFEPGQSWNLLELSVVSTGSTTDCCSVVEPVETTVRIGFAICEDFWRETDIPGTHYKSDPVRALLDAGADIICVPSASPFYSGKDATRRALAEKIANRGNIPIVYINAVGANDSIIFDGRSFVMQPDGKVSVVAKGFEEDLITWDNTLRVSAPPREIPQYDIIENALVLGIREYMQKCGFTHCHLGLSGGIDSALVAYLAVQAVGKDNVACFSMPSRFSSDGSKDDAAELAVNLGCRYETLPIEPGFKAFLETLKPVFEDRPFDIAEENLQARIRGTLMMAYSNKFNSMLLATGNKSELAMGYCTLYGDMCGSLAPIGDLFKTEVFGLCKRINQRAGDEGRKPPIPQAIIDKPPSAELRPNQKDQDSLPPYDTLDAVLRLYLFDNLSAKEIVETCANDKCSYEHMNICALDEALVQSIIKTTARAEFKRRQAPPVLKVSPRAFGMGRRMPIARAVFEI
ncbi:MAG: NAD+ synthase [Spirochaetaceae bacterium]|jgi:NAD+ synthase (glutamine-hydrolysing)|nr:NAD+ synthase [Spirochaetaceae bacterium]